MASLHPPTTRAKRRLVLALLAIACLLTLGLLYAAGYRPLVVTSASMAPAVDSGDLIITRAVAPGAVAVGDVVSFHDRSREGTLVTHRVTAMDRAGREVALVTRGDVNSGVERWSSAADARIGKLAMRIPHAGYAVTWGTRLPIILALLAIVALVFVRAVGAARQTPRPARCVGASALAALVSAASIVSVPILLAATEGAFSAVAANAGNSFQAAASFCGPLTLNATQDTAIKQVSPGTNYGNVAEIAVQSHLGDNLRTLVQFAVPSVPTGCTFATAKLRLSLDPGSFIVGFPRGMGRTLQALRVTSAWSESTATWGPAGAGPPATTPIGQASYTTGFNGNPHDIVVTAQVAATIATPSTNYGFLIRDNAEDYNGGATTPAQLYFSREAPADGPTLTVTYTAL